jgi:hypothetical protein
VSDLIARCPYPIEDPHPTARCPDCNARLILKWARCYYWTCDAFPRCRYSCNNVENSFEPEILELATPADRREVEALVLGITRDELASRTDVLQIVFATIGRKARIRLLLPGDIAPVLAALHAFRREREAGRPVEVRNTQSTCCETVRDTHGSLTICWERRRWCLGRAEHATRPEHTEALRDETWADGYDGDGWEDALREDAQAAFVAADSRRRR